MNYKQDQNEGDNSNQGWREGRLNAANNMCRKCDDARKEKATLDRENPLKNSCRCHLVDKVLSLYD